MPGFYALITRPQAPCLHPWADIWVNAAGLVSCCPQNRCFWGNIHQQSVEELWNSPKSQRVRHLVAAGQYLAAGCDKDCPYLRGVARHPEVMPPVAELINPDFDLVEDDTPYARNLRQVAAEYLVGQEELRSRPLFVDTQPVLRCNADCVMCGQPHRAPLEHSAEILQALEVLRPTANWFRWQGGEVFVSKRFFSYLRDFSAPDCPHLRRYVITNGTLLNEGRVDELVQGAVPIFFLLSIDGVRRETYAAIRRKLDYDRAWATLKYLASVQRHYGRRLVCWNYVVMRSTLDEVAEAIDIADELGVDLNLAPIQGEYPTENIFLHPGLAGPDLSEMLQRLEARVRQARVRVSGFAGLRFRLSARQDVG
ncbi:MAG: hypothetical protein BWK76_05530 [Desulfobulbaceae bacterium A2]|nr:MAG: hypothetical protein BWK76_05530 [Desulfobulbaceae bacterium A2]